MRFQTILLLLAGMCVVSGCGSSRNPGGSKAFVEKAGRIPAPLQSLRNWCAVRQIPFIILRV